MNERTIKVSKSQTETDCCPDLTEDLQIAEHERAHGDGEHQAGRGHHRAGAGHRTDDAGLQVRREFPP